MSVVPCAVTRCCKAAHQVKAVHVGALLGQELHRVQVPVVRRSAERRLHHLRTKLSLSPAPGVLSGAVEGQRGAHHVALLNVCALFQQQLDAGEVACTSSASR